MKKIDKKTALQFSIDGAFIVASAAILALAMYMFIIPAKFAPGGIAGLSSIIEVVFGFSASYSLVIFNLPLVILGFFYLSKRFAIKTTITIALTSGIMEIYKAIHLYQFVDSSNLILSALAAGILYGVGIGLLLNRESSVGGTEIISMLIRKKYSSLSISWIVFILNTVIVLIGGTLYLFVLKLNATYVFTIIMYSLLENFVYSKCLELVLKGSSSSVKFEIITNIPQEMSKVISEKTKRGVTIVESHGGYSNEKNFLVICVVYKAETQLLRKIVKEVDPNSFAFVMDTREVWGNGFNSKR